jgi:TPR repeat protein
LQLAKNYLLAQGTEKDVDEALYWAIFAARFGEANAFDLIYDILAKADPAKLAELGLDPKLVMSQLNASAKAGNKYSQYYLGRVFEDQAKKDGALVWYRKASAQGLRQATDAIDRLSKKGGSR